MVAAQSGSPRGPPEEFAAAAQEWIEHVSERVRKSIVAKQYALMKATLALTESNNAVVKALDAMNKCHCMQQDPAVATA